MRRLNLHGQTFEIRFLESPTEMDAVEEIQRAVWPGSETDVVPSHLLLTIAHNGGVVLGAYHLESGRMAGFVYGFPCMAETADGWQFKHCSHQLGVHPDFRNLGLSFHLKRAQWQWVRHQGLPLITWTYDPLLSRNAHLNIRKLGGVCRTYLREVYGQMRDGLNAGLPSDRFQVELWVEAPRVLRRLETAPPLALDLAHYLSAGAQILNPSARGEGDFPVPMPPPAPAAGDLLLVEIPSDFQALRATDRDLALRWRLHTREIFEDLFARGYLVTDHVYLPEPFPRSFYVLTHGEATLGV
ncbi:MAG TPA: hypothetical protein ENJ54_06020 [Chloroflexi bacterium]|nr:hypothetical protein [Chloroflexota bacterium]